jgi:NTE family protein
VTFARLLSLRRLSRRRFQIYATLANRSLFRARPVPEEQRSEESRLTAEVGLALSGGGFRAVLFHVGSLWRLAELGVLAKLDRISSVSGGSIVAGRLAECWTDLGTPPMLDRFRELVAEPLQSFCRRTVDAVAISRGALSPFRTAADVLEEIYAEHLFAKRLNQLPDRPTFVFNSTNMQTGRSFRFTKKYLADWRIGMLKNPSLPIAKAVTASSAFPPMLSPVVLKDVGQFEAVEGADLNDDPFYTRKLYLSDGGVYDNLGLETVWNRCSTVLVSDAGAPFSVGPNPGNDWVRQPMRALDIATDQSRGLRKRRIVDDYQRGERKGTYWGIDTDIEKYGLPDALKASPTVVETLAQIRTRLDPFSDEEQGRLINWGYALADAALRTYASHLITSPTAPCWPKPDFALG